MATTETENGRIAQALEAIRAEIQDSQMRRLDAFAALRELDDVLERLRVAERALDPQSPGPAKATPKGPVARGSTADAALAILTELRSATQAEVAVRLGRRKNTARAALEQLVARGVVVQTGAFDKRSPVFALAES